MITIYKLTAPNGRNYVGQTYNLKNRFSQYKGMWCKGQPRLYNSLKKYGWERFTKEILECIPKELADEYEQHYISVFRCCEIGLNLDSGGHANKIASESTRLKISLAAKGRPLTEKQKLHLLKMQLANKGKLHTKEHKLKMSAAMKGKKHGLMSEERKLKMSIAHKGKDNHQTGRHHTETTKLNMSRARKGKKLTDAARHNMSISQIGKKRAPFSEEWKKKLSLAHKGKKRGHYKKSNKNMEGRILKVLHVAIPIF
jgi:group I intron endonuclease